MKKTLIVGASTNHERYSHKAVLRLLQSNHEVVPYGRQEGTIRGLGIETEWPSEQEDIHTVSLYIRDSYQKDLYDNILSLKPKRIIFNPGTENPEFSRIAANEGIEVLNACTLVMLSIGDY